MKRRLDLALALVHDPRILFLDEPTTGLDPASRAAIWEEVRRLNDELGMTIFLTTQYLEEADRLADRIAIINKGRIVAQGTPEELKREVGDEVVELQFGSSEDAERAYDALAPVAPNRQRRTASCGSTSDAPPRTCPSWSAPSTATASGCRASPSSSRASTTSSCASPARRWNTRWTRARRTSRPARR